MKILLILFLLSALFAGLILIFLQLGREAEPRNRRRQPADLDFQRWRQHKTAAPTFDTGRQLERTLKPKINGHHKHERKPLP